MSSRVIPRSVSTATRFTSQTPQASAKAAAARGPIGETTAQRVTRLRAAHLAARQASLSKTDQIILKGRHFFDAMHRATQRGLLGLTAVAFIFTVYAAIDMIKFNKQRKAEFLEAQAKMEVDGLAAARIAYISGQATPEQVHMVEEAIEKAGNQKLPPLLDPPSKPIKSSIWDTVDAKVAGQNGGAATSSATSATAAVTSPSKSQAPAQEAKSEKRWWFF